MRLAIGLFWRHSISGATLPITVIVKPAKHGNPLCKDRQAVQKSASWALALLAALWHSVLPRLGLMYAAGRAVCGRLTMLKSLLVMTVLRPFLMG